MRDAAEVTEGRTPRRPEVEWSLPRGGATLCRVKRVVRLIAAAAFVAALAVAVWLRWPVARADPPLGSDDGSGVLTGKKLIGAFSAARFFLVEPAYGSGTKSAAGAIRIEGPEPVRIRPKQLRVGPGLDTKAVVGALVSSEHWARGCRARRPGKVGAKAGLVVTMTGTVTRAKITTEPAAAEVVQCLEAWAGTLRFPTPDATVMADARTVELDYEFELWPR